MDPKTYFVDYDPAIGTMPREPKDVFSDNVPTRMSFGEFEMERVAQVLLRLQTKGIWTGVSWPCMITIHAGTQSWWTRLWNNLRKVPQMPQKTNGHDVDIAIICNGNLNIQEASVNGAPLSLLTGVRHLEEDGFVAIKEVNGCDYVFPTPKLIEKYLEQRRCWEAQQATSPRE